MEDHLYQGDLFLPRTEFTRLPRKVLTLWRIEIGLAALVLTAVAALVLGLGTPRWLGWDRGWVLVSAAIPLQAAWMWFRLPTRWRFTGYRLADEEVLVRRGLLQRSLEAFPYGRIQLVEVASGFLARRLGLAHVTVSIGVRERVEMGPVLAEEAERLRNKLTDLTRQKAVEL
ncbi:PH domain-containing protein [Streptomyces microflavus]|uniref:PH domain-containing protein n=1 Tax=Streptomyces microflavus TaxID=1919 RepID=UPI0037F7B329